MGVIRIYAKFHHNSKAWESAKENTASLVVFNIAKQLLPPPPCSEKWLLVCGKS